LPNAGQMHSAEEKACIGAGCLVSRKSESAWHRSWRTASKNHRFALDRDKPVRAKMGGAVQVAVPLECLDYIPEDEVLVGGCNAEDIL